MAQILPSVFGANILRLQEEIQFLEKEKTEIYMKKRDKTEGSSVYINRGTERTRNRFFWRKGDVYENTYGRVCRVRNAHLFLRWGARRTEGHHSY